MAFPVVISSNHGNKSTATATQVVPMPPDYRVGDMLLCFYASDSSTANLDVSSSDWTQLSLANASPWMCVAWKIAEGGDVLTMASAFPHYGAWVIYAIRGADSIEGSHQVSGDSDSVPNPPLLTLSKTRDALWFAAGSADNPDSGGATPSVTGAPSGYSSLIIDESTFNGGPSIGVAQRNLRTNSQDPGAFTSDFLAGTTAYTIAVWNSPAGGMFFGANF